MYIQWNNISFPSIFLHIINVCSNILQAFDNINFYIFFSVNFLNTGFWIWYMLTFKLIITEELNASHCWTPVHRKVQSSQFRQNQNLLLFIPFHKVNELFYEIHWCNMWSKICSLFQNIKDHPQNFLLFCPGVFSLSLTREFGYPLVYFTYLFLNSCTIKRTNQKYKTVWNETITG